MEWKRFTGSGEKFHGFSPVQGILKKTDFFEIGVNKS